MIVKKFEDILNELRNDQLELQNKLSLDWYLGKIRVMLEGEDKEGPSRIKTQDRQNIKDSAIGIDSSYSQAMVGKMIIYTYDPKHKATLPYYDTFPLVFPLEPSKSVRGSFLGLNMHYLPPYYRAQLMTALWTTVNNTEIMDARTRLKLAYSTLKGSTRFRQFKPCLKMYLTSHIRSQIMIIDPHQWNYVLMMPVARFKKASQYQVWADSIRSITTTTKPKKCDGWTSFAILANCREWLWRRAP